jgi:hypothetical protein
MTKPPLADVPIRSADELTRRWETVLEPPVFGARSLWLAWLDDDGLMLPIIAPIDDMPVRLDRALGEGLRQIHLGVLHGHLGGQGHLAMVLCRPGRPEVTKDDDAWAEALCEALDGLPATTWSLHLAAGGQVQALVDLPW